LIDEGPAVIGGDKRNIRKPMSRSGKDPKQFNVSYEGSVLREKRVGHHIPRLFIVMLMMFLAL